MFAQNLFLYALLSMMVAATPVVEVVEEAQALEARQNIVCGVHYNFGVSGGCGKISTSTPGRRSRYAFGSGFNITAFPNCIVTIVTSADCTNWQFAGFDDCGSAHQVTISPDNASSYTANGCQPQSAAAQIGPQ